MTNGKSEKVISYHCCVLVQAQPSMRSALPSFRQSWKGVWAGRVEWSYTPLHGGGIQEEWASCASAGFLSEELPSLSLESCQHPNLEESVGFVALCCWSTWWCLYSMSYFIFFINSVSNLKTFLSWCQCCSWAESACLSLVKPDKNSCSEIFLFFFFFSSWKFLIS